MSDIQNHTLPGQFRRCSGAVIAGTGSGGLFSDEATEDASPDASVVNAVISVLELAAGRATSAASEPEPHLRRLQALAYLAGAVDSALFIEVRKLRDQGAVSWSQVAEATGAASKQAAAYRFRGA